MKKINLLSLLVIMMAFVSSCSSDDEPKNLAAETTGRYTGYTLASCQYFSNMAASDQVVTITSSEVNKVNISYTSDTWGTMTIDGADLSGGAGSILIKGAGKSSMAHAEALPKNMTALLRVLWLETIFRSHFLARRLWEALKSNSNRVIFLLKS